MTVGHPWTGPTGPTLDQQPQPERGPDDVPDGQRKAVDEVAAGINPKSNGRVSTGQPVLSINNGGKP